MEGTGEVVRIRLIFEDEFILNRRQRSEGLKQCWMIVKPYLKTVEQIASDISFTFHLHRTCPRGLLLSMEGYTLPSTQPTCILKDKDIVVVNKKRDTSEKRILICEEASPKDSQTFGERVEGHNGVKLLAIDEFEEAAGGYQSEYEDNGINSKDDADMIHMGKHSIQKEISKKKRKQSELVGHSRVKNVVPNKHGICPLQVVSEIGNDERNHKKRKKISHSEEIPCNAVKDNNHTKALEVEVENPEGVGLQLKKKVPRKKLKEKKKQCVKVNRESNEFPQVNLMAEECLEREDDHVKEIAIAMENASMPTEGGKKSPSRSSKRKKAKRRWLREQKAKNQELVQSNGLLDEKLQPKSDKPQKSNQDDDIEAEEESLPVVVRPGHIRFLCLDEEYESQEIQDSVELRERAHHTRSTIDQLQRKLQEKEIELEALQKELELQKIETGHWENRAFKLLEKHKTIDAEDYDSVKSELEQLQPVSQWNGITTKRQGQNWGKEKNSRVNRVKEPVCSREEDNIASDDTKEETLNNCPLDFDKLPSMSGLPQQGDVIAYRLVELSVTSWCPELSSFRVGKIASYDGHSTKIRLVPVSEYPLVVKNSLSEEYAEETDISLYNEDGSLEVDFGSLVDVRWIYQQNCSINIHTDIPDVNVAGEVAMCRNGERNSNIGADMNTGFPVTKEPTTTTNANGDGENMNVWDEINQAFSSKKAELSLKEDHLKPVNMDAKPTKISKKSRSKATNENPCISKQGNVTPTSRTFKSLRGSAIGPTISLLRAQNILQ